MTNDSNEPRSGRSRRYVDRRRFLAGSASAATLTLLAGCAGGGGSGGSGGDSGSSGGDSGGSSGDSGGSSGGTTDTSGGSSETITVGASAALTGKYSVEGKATAEGYELWAQQLNEEGSILTDGDETGLLGREVEMVVYDDQSDPSRAVNLYKRLINEDDVDLMMGPYSSAVSTSVMPIIEQSQTACVMPMMSDTSVLTERDVNYIVQAIAPSSTYLKGAIDIGVENGAESVAIVYEDTAFPTSIAEGHVPYIEEKGLEIVHQSSYPKDINDYTSVMNKVQSSGADLAIGGAYTPDAIGLTTAAKSIGYSPGMMAWTVGTTAPSFYDSVGGDALAVSGDLFWAPWFQVPYNEPTKQAITNFYDYDDLSNVDYHLVGGYAGTLVMEQAVRNVGSLDQAAIAEELHSLEMGVPWGNGTYRVDDNGVQVGHAPSLGQWQEADGDGLTREAVWPSEYATDDPVYPHPGWS